MAIKISPNKFKKKGEIDIEKHIIPTSKAKGPLKMVVYGRNKQGKTHFAGSSNLKTLIIDCNEKGSGETLDDRENCSVYHLSNWKEEHDLYWWLRTAKHDYQVVAVDTVSSLATLCMKYVMKEAEHDGADPSMPQRQHWGKVASLMTEFLTDWRNLPLHVIFLAQERKWIEEDDESEEEGAVVIEVTPSLSKAPLQTLLSVVGTIGRIYVRETEKEGKKVFEHRMLLGPHERYSGGTRIKGLPRVMRDPTLQKILDIRDTRGEHKPGKATHGIDF